VPEQVRVVELLPHEDEVRGRHEVGHERAAARGTRKRIGADAEPAGVILAAVLLPQLLDLALEDFLFEEQSSALRRLHALRLARRTKAAVGSREVGDFAATEAGGPG
jgi:hypothetical protein